MVDHAQVPGVEDESSPLVLLHRQVHARPGLLHHRVFPAAGVRAGSPVRVSSREVVGQEASSRIGNAHRAVYEGLDLPVLRDLPADLRDLDQAQLTRAYYALGSHFEPEIKGAVVGVVSLGGNVDRDIGAGLARQHEHARIRHQDRVRSQLRQLAKILLRPGKIAVVGQNVGSDEYLHAMLVGVSDSLRHIVP